MSGRKKITVALLATLLGLIVALAMAAWLGEDPIYILGLMLQGSLGSATNIGYSLYYATPLILTGLSVAWAFKAGLFNIGAEGQMTLGGVAQAAVGILLPNLPSVIALPLALITGFLVGGLWGGLAGWMKAKRGCHEVLSTILLNFVAYGLAAFFIVSVLRNPESQNPETFSIGENYRIALIGFLGGASPLNWFLALALGIAVVQWFVFKKTAFGYRQRLVGGSPETAKRAGIKMDREVIVAMFISGGLAGLAGSNYVLGFLGKAREGFTAGAGFMGVAVALLGGTSAFGVVLAAIFFGILSKGSLVLEIDADFVTRDLAVVIQAVVVLAVASQNGLLSTYEEFCKMISRWRRAR